MFSCCRDASEDDLRLWLPQPEKSVAELDTDMSLFLLTHVGDQFCWMVQTEKEAKAEALAAEAEDGDAVPQQIAWKRVVQGVREMCDVCETTLFNFHWACGKCGYVVCIDCYKTRKAAKSPSNGNGSGNKDDEKEVLLAITNIVFVLNDLLLLFFSLCVCISVFLFLFILFSFTCSSILHVFSFQTKRKTWFLSFS